LGIGANTAIFSAIDALMLRPLPFTAADQLVRIYSIQKGMSNSFGNPNGPSALDVRDFAQRSRSFQGMIIYDTWRKNVSFGDSAGQPEQMSVGLVPASYFEILDIHPIIGRLFAEDENQEGKNHVAAISAKLWRDRYASDESILGHNIRINGEPYTIVAVMPDQIPAWMEPGRQSEVWTPFPYSADMWSESERGSRGFAALARLKPGVSLEQAQADLTVIAAALRQSILSIKGSA
jgi:putative ABC transport system permease protein